MRLSWARLSEEGTFEATHSRKAWRLDKTQAMGAGSSSKIGTKESHSQLLGPPGSPHESEPCLKPGTLLHTEPQSCPHSRPSRRLGFILDGANLSFPRGNPQVRGGSGSGPLRNQHGSAESWLPAG